jgi:hypothetical protein
MLYRSLKMKARVEPLKSTRTRDALLAEIEQFLIEHGMGAVEFGRRAVGDTSFVTRLRKGVDIRVSSYDQAVDFMAARKTEAQNDGANRAA